MDMYDSKVVENSSEEMLITKIAHIAHELDKIINTECTSPKFNKIASETIKNLIEVLETRERRSLPQNDIIEWAQRLLTEANEIISKANLYNYPERSYKNKIDLENADKLLRLIRTRRSIRSWTKEGVPQEAVQLLLEAAIWAPSSGNRQSVRYVVLEDEEQRMALVKLREKFLGCAPLLIFIGADSRNYYPEEVEVVPYLDAAVATQNLLLMAHAMGLGAIMVKCTNVDIKMDAVWSGGYERRRAVSEMYSKLNLPNYFLPVAIVAVGYPKRVPKAPPRLRKDDIRFFERFIESSECSNLKSGESTIKDRSKLLIIKMIHRIVKHLGIRVYITLD